MMLSILRSTIAAITLSSTLLMAAEQQPGREQIAAFEQAFAKSWKAGDLKGLKPLHALEGVPDGIIRNRHFFWAQLLEIYSDKEQFSGIEYRSREEYVKGDTRPTSHRRLLFEPQNLNGTEYEASIPPCGVVTVLFRKNERAVFPVGLAPDGSLKFVVEKPKDGSPDPLPAPIPAPKPIAEPPGQEAITRFCAALEAAAKAKDFTAITSRYGASRFVYNQAVTLPKEALSEVDPATISVSFSPLSEQSEMKPFVAPKKLAGDFLGPNLPVVGTATIRWPNGSVTFLVGVTPSGEWQKVLQVPVVVEE